MKRALSFVLCLLLIASLTVPVFASDSISSGTTIRIQDIDVSEDTACAPDHLYPFIYALDEDWAYFRELIGPCDCEPGYMYVKNMNTNQIVRVYDHPVSTFVETLDYLYLVTENNQLLQVTYDGASVSPLTDVSSVPVSNLWYCDNHLFFIAKNNLVKFSISDRTATIIRTDSKLKSFYVFSEKYILCDLNDGTSYVMDVNKKVPQAIPENMSALDFVTCVENQNFCEDASDASINATNATQASFPLSGYTNGDYFTTNGLACDHANGVKYCKTYASSNQCDGFAWYAHNKYNHIAGSTWSKPSKPAGDTTKGRTKFSSATDVRQYFTALTKGAYVRVSTAENPSGGQHSLVYVSGSSTKMTTYECNRNDDCGIFYGSRTYQSIITYYGYTHTSVSHSYNDRYALYSDSYHKVICDNCSAYLLRPHYSESPGTNATCVACGHVGQIDVGIASIEDPYTD